MAIFTPAVFHKGKPYINESGLLLAASGFNVCEAAFEYQPRRPEESVLRDVTQIFVRTIFSSIRRRAGIAASNRKARCGAVGFIQRFSDALHLDPHFHVMALDGIYIENSKNELTFQPVGPPSDAEVARVAARVHRSVMRLMEKRGIGPQEDSQDTLQLDEPLLAELYSASIAGRVATGPRSGRPIERVGDEVESKQAAAKLESCCAMVEGFSVHAGVCVPAHDRFRLERLLGLCGDPHNLNYADPGIMRTTGVFAVW